MSWVQDSRGIVYGWVDSSLPEQFFGGKWEVRARSAFGGLASFKDVRSPEEILACFHKCLLFGRALI